MTSNGTHTISLQKIYNADAAVIYNLFKDSTIFKLTGADNIQFDFQIGSPFRLTFNNRGIIYGKFINISATEISLEWNVDGFQRPTETGTMVEISIRNENEKCTLTLIHKNIINTDAAFAKKRAWSEIFDEIQNRIKH